LLTASLLTPVSGGISIAGTPKRTVIFMKILPQFRVICACLDKAVLHPRKLLSIGHDNRFEMVEAKYLMGNTPIGVATEMNQ
jgi:hypothetical protein